MKIISITFLLTFFSFCNSYSQSFAPEWIQRFNAVESSFDIPTNMAIDSAGNVYVTGKSWSDGSDYDYSTVKYNSSGVFLWEARYNGPGNYTDIPNSVAVDKSGNVYVTGKSYGNGTDYDYATVKYNSNGVQQWVDRYNGAGNSTDEANSIAVNDSGNVFITGTSDELNTFSSHISSCTSIKLNSGGIRNWINKYTDQNGYYGKSNITDNEGNLYVGGNGGFSSSVIKYNSYGVQQWLCSDLNFGDLKTIEVDKQKNVFMLRQSTLIKINGNGNLLWTKFPSANESFSYIRIDRSSNFYLISTIQIGGITASDISTSKYDSNGILQWKSIYNGGGNLNDLSNSLCVDSSGNVYSTGNSAYYQYNSDFVTIKYNSSGIKQWVSKYSGPAGYEDAPSAICIDKTGNAYVTGYSYGIGTDFDYLTIKYPGSLQLNATILMEGFYNENTNRLNRKDTLTAYLRNISFPHAIVDSGKSVIDTLNFRCGFCFNNAPAGTYYIAIKHRNSIETWSKTGGEVFSKSSPVYYDFTASASQAYGSNLVLKGSRYCIFSGNINQDGIIDASDQSQVDNDSFSGLSGSFLSSDVNGDNYVDASDVGIVDNNRSVVISRPYF